MDKGCRVQEAVCFSGKNSGPEIVIPIIPLPCQVLWGETQGCSNLGSFYSLEKEVVIVVPVKFPGFCENTIDYGFKGENILLYVFEG